MRILFGALSIILCRRCLLGFLNDFVRSVSVVPTFFFASPVRPVAFKVSGCENACAQTSSSSSNILVVRMMAIVDDYTRLL